LVDVDHSNELGEFLQCICHHDKIINIVLGIIIIIIIIITAELGRTLL